MTLKDIVGVVEASGINLTQASYIIALMATFDDIETRRGENAGVRLVTHREKYGLPI